MKDRNDGLHIMLAAMFFLFVAIPLLGAWTVAAWACDGAQKLFKKGHGYG